MASDKPAAVIVDSWSRDDPRMFQADQTGRLDCISPLRIPGRASLLWAMFPKTQLEYWRFSGRPYLWVSVLALLLSRWLTNVLEERLLEKGEKVLERGHGAKRTWFP